MAARDEARLRLENEQLRRALGDLFAMVRPPVDALELGRLRAASELLDRPAVVSAIRALDVSADEGARGRVADRLGLKK
jgi:hypothetical protein